MGSGGLFWSRVLLSLPLLPVTGGGTAGAGATAAAAGALGIAGGRGGRATSLSSVPCPSRRLSAREHPLCSQWMLANAFE